MAKKLTSEKAREILHDKSVHGHPLTDKQRRFFGAIAGGAPIKAKSGGWLDSYQEGGVESTQAGYTDIPFNYNSAWGGQFQNGGISFLSLPQEDPEMMYVDRFNTPLTEEETKSFNEWVAKESERQGRDIMMDKGAYDVQGFWKSGDYKKMDKDNHGNDMWKKPNHPTFSNQSKYHGIDGFYGGNWNPDGGYQPSKQTASSYGPSYYNWMFGLEPNRPEHLDASRYRSGINKPSPLYYAMGGSLPGSVGFTYARTQGAAPSNGPYAKKTKPSAQDGKTIHPIDLHLPKYEKPKPFFTGYGFSQNPVSNVNIHGVGAYGTGNINDRLNLSGNINSASVFYPGGEKMFMNPRFEVGMKYKFDNGGSMTYYQHGLDWKPKTISKDGSVIKDDRGQWAHPGEITEIQGNTMATHGYGDLPLYVVPDVGEPRVVNANTGTHTFPGATKFTEFPITQKVNQKENGGWLNQYK